MIDIRFNVYSPVMNTSVPVDEKTADYTDFQLSDPQWWSGLGVTKASLVFTTDLGIMAHAIYGANDYKNGVRSYFKSLFPNVTWSNFKG